MVLHGGEPLIIGNARLERTLSVLRDAISDECSLNIQTNGILITNPLLDICSKYAASLSVSLDGPKHIHDRNRKGQLGQPTYDQVVKGIKTLQAHANSAFLFSGLLAVIDPNSQPNAVYQHLKSFGTPSISFLCRDGNRSSLPYGKSEIDSTEYGNWLNELLDIYLADPSPPRIRNLDDMIKLVLGGTNEKEGVGINDFGIVVIDTDGSITKNDTLKSSFDGADRFDQNWNVHTHTLAEICGSRKYVEYHKLQRPSSSTCLSCPELRVCGGGMPLHRWSSERGYDNPSVYCSDQKMLISRVRMRLQEYLAAA